MTKKRLHPYHESHIRSISKALTWRVVATTTTFLITYFVILSNEKAEIPKDLLDAAAREAMRHTAQAKAISKAFYFAGSVAILDLVIKLLLYYFHERIWQSINFGWIHKHGRRRRINKIRNKRLKDLLKQ